MPDEHEKVAQAFAGMSGKGWLRSNCPICVEDHKLSIGFNTATGGYNCFKCGSKGHLPQYLRELAPFSAPEPEETERAIIGLPEGFVEIYKEPGWSASMFDRARSYMQGTRKISESICAAARVGTTISGWLSGRVIIPMVEDGIGRGWIARDYTKTATLPYMYPKGMARLSTLFNVAALYDELNHPALIVEGCFDALPYWPDAAACLGKPLESHIPLILAAKRPVVVVLDGDAWEEGWAFALKCRHLGGRVTSLRLPAGEDPCSVDRHWLRVSARAAAQGM